MTPEMSKKVSMVVAPHAAEAYQRAVRNGYPRPAAGVRIRGILREGEDANIPGAIKAVNLAAVIEKLSPEMAAAVEANLVNPPAGHYPCIVVDDGPEPPSILWYPLPDKD
jgi:hypothetical protein